MMASSTVPVFRNLTTVFNERNNEYTNLQLRHPRCVKSKQTKEGKVKTQL